jgi:hypothetical protein
MSKLFGWLSLVGGLAAVVGDAAGVVGGTVANVAMTIALILGNLAKPITGKGSKDQEAESALPRRR